MAKKFAFFGFCIGLLISGLVFLAEQTTQEIAWLLLGSFPLCWGIGGYLLGLNNKQC